MPKRRKSRGFSSVRRDFCECGTKNEDIRERETCFVWV